MACAARPARPRDEREDRGPPLIHVPPAFAASTVAREGEAGEAWLASLPALIEELCEHWGLEVAGAPMHGYVAVVVPVLRDCVPLALKVSWIDRSSEQEALVLRAWDGRGAVRLLEAREEAGALLLEWLDPDRSLAEVTIDRACTIAGELLRRLAIEPPPGLRTVAAEMSEFREAVESGWERFGSPFSQTLLERVLETSRLESRSPRIVNQDLHYENVLAGVREPWLVIDPKALAGDPEFGVAPLLWTRFEELESRAGLELRLGIIAEAAELDHELAGQWSLVRVVDYWIWALEEGLTDDPVRCRTLARWLAPELGG